MNEASLRALLEQVRRDETDIDTALHTLRRMPFDDAGVAKLDTHRALRNGFPEVVLCEGKQPEHVLTIMQRLCVGAGPVLATRAAPGVAALVQEALPQVRYNALGRLLIYEPQPLPKRPGQILVISAGTADLPVAEEAAGTADIMGHQVDRIFDVGVAGLHRLLAHLDRLEAASVVVVVAGMEGALPSVVGGLVRRPVIAVPTSVGYGASFGGLAALLGMLNSCAAGVTVVNIDNGFGAGFAAAKINTLAADSSAAD
ncbi:MAG: nickel pincer cofactor biosynthesis protein LarB [Roseiflexaceae bacterium]